MLLGCRVDVDLKWGNITPLLLFFHSQQREKVNNVRMFVSWPGHIHGFVLDGQSC